MSGLQPKDEIRIIAPSQSWAAKYAADYKRAQACLEAAGFVVSLSKNIQKQAVLQAATAAERAADVTAAYADPRVKAIIALRGGWLTNEILPFIDWQVVAANPKPLIGFSDITVLLNAVIAKTGQMGYLGPTLGAFADPRFGQKMLGDLLAVLSGEPVQLVPSAYWGLPKQKVRRKAAAWKTLQPGTARGRLVGGNAGTFFLGQGTEYLAPFDQDYILAIEDDDEAGEYTAREFSRRLESILQLPGARQHLKGMLIGRFLPNSKVTDADLAAIIAAKQLGDIPVLIGMDFGHSLPNATLPLGGQATMQVGRVGANAVVIVQAKAL